MQDAAGLLNRCHVGCVLDVLPCLAAQGLQAQCVVTSPPYWGLRDYNVEPREWPSVTFSPMPGLPEMVIPAWKGCLGLEPDVMLWVGHMVAVFRMVWEVLADDGVLWLNLGDSYAGAVGGNRHSGFNSRWHGRGGGKQDQVSGAFPKAEKRGCGLKDKDMSGQPWRLAFALQADGWYLRQDIIWQKPNPMPESVSDRCTKAHEYLFLMTKSPRYHYDAEAIKEPVSGTAHSRGATGGVNPKVLKTPAGWDTGDGAHNGFTGRYKPKQNPNYSSAIGSVGLVSSRNRRSVWSVPSQAYAGAHFATFPPRLIEPCILAGSRLGDVVLDPFFGSGTTGEVAQGLGRQWVGVELNPGYGALQAERTAQAGLPL